MSFLDVDAVVYIFYRQQGGLVEDKSIFVIEKWWCWILVEIY